jgi:cation transport regulator ChaB
MSADREVQGVRICTKERIEKMSQGSLTRYRKAIREAKRLAHNWYSDHSDYYGFNPKESADDIKALDWAWNAVKREVEKRKEQGEWE